MHSSLIFLTLISIILITFMVTCFFYFIRSRRKEEAELMEQVHYNNPNQIYNQHQLTTPQRLEQSKHSTPSNANNEMLIEDSRQQQQQQQQYNRQQSQQMAEFQSRNSYTASPYHSAAAQRPETQSDITLQINSAIIGSSEAEFQNDFIQVFPMYQIAPQPEKNTTPYMT